MRSSFLQTGIVGLPAHKFCKKKSRLDFCRSLDRKRSLISGEAERGLISRQNSG